MTALPSTAGGVRSGLAVAAALFAVALAACGNGDDDRGAQVTGTAETPQADPATTGRSATPPDGREPPFSPSYVFSGDDVQKCVEGEGLSAEREQKPAGDDKVGQGVVHDRLLVGGRSGDPALRLFMFGSEDLAKEQGEQVAERSPRSQVLGTVILEPLTGETSEESNAVIDCLKQQADG